MSTNDAIAAEFETMADLLEAKDVDFKPRAYRRAAERLRELPEPVEARAADGPPALEDLEGIGEAIAEKIVQYLETGQIDELEALREEFPVDMDALTRVEGLGPKRVAALYEALGITTLDDLEAAAEAGDIQQVEGFGATTESNILEHLPFARRAADRHVLSTGREVAEAVLEVVRDADAAIRADVAGSIRRWLPTVGDIDLLVSTDDPGAVLEAVTAARFIVETVEAGERKARVRTDEGVAVDFRFVDDDTFGAALQYFTGSKDHNVQLRRLAIEDDLKINEYGVFRRDDTRIAGETEASVYESVGLPFIPPELREARGELEAATQDALPTLVETADVRGDLHVHSEWSDGAASIDDLAAIADQRGYAYVAVTDHVPGSGVQGAIAMPIEDLEDRAAAIERADEAHEVTVLAGIEANVEPDGSIDVPDHALDALDVVVASPHAALGQDRDEATARLIAAIEHPAVDVIGHPTGRKSGIRPGLDPDIDRVAAAAADHGVALEVNSHPVRLDLGGGAVKRAIDAGASIVISTDSHRPAEFEHMRYGVHTARRGWAQPEQVVNTRSAEGLSDWLA